MSGGDGFLLAIDKAAGWTSHDVVAFLRCRLQQRTIGHAGTLDPFATGLLLVGITRAATVELANWSMQEKEYLATIRFGYATDTDDITGNVIAQGDVPNEAALRAIVPQFLGEQQQLPPRYSAVKSGGRKSYIAARHDEKLTLQPRPVFLALLDTIAWTPPDWTVRIVCSKGTYIRALARDIGAALGSAALLASLRRLRIGTVSVATAVPISEAAAALNDGVTAAPFIIERYPAAASCIV